MTLLNVLAPGAGLLRIGRGRRALIAYGVAVVGLVIFIAAASTTDHISFALYAVLVVLMLATTLAGYAMALWWTWIGSLIVNQQRPIWARWYFIVLAIAVSFGASAGLTSLSKGLYRNFYLPAEGMEPTLIKSDRLVASMRLPGDLRRGDILVVQAPTNAMYVKRLAALPGDRISLRGGIVAINGVQVTQQPAGQRRVSYPYVDAKEARLYRERFPGEGRAHVIQDLGTSAEDDFAQVTVAPGHVFVLGDNRDDSADSRVPRAMGGLEQVPLRDVRGRALFIYWPMRRMGESLRTNEP